MTDTRTTFMSLICLIICAITYPILSQAPMIGFDFGYGRSQMTSNGHSFISPFDQDYYKRSHIGLEFSQPVSSWLSLSSGLEFINRKGTDDYFNYLTLPLYVDLTLGNSFQFLIGPGLHMTYLISYDLGYYKNHPGFKVSKNEVQVNWQLHAGISVMITQKTRIHFLYEQGFDLTTIYDHTDRHPDHVQSERWYDGMLTAGVKTFLFEKESQ